MIRHVYLILRDQPVGKLHEPRPLPARCDPDVLAADSSLPSAKLFVHDRKKRFFGLASSAFQCDQQTSNLARRFANDRRRSSSLQSIGPNPGIRHSGHHRHFGPIRSTISHYRVGSQNKTTST